MVELKSIFRDIAKLRWPNAARITGEGAFAVVIRCGHWPTVQLFGTRTEAFNTSKAACGQNCKHAHGWIELKRPAPRWKPKPHWARMIED